MCVCIIVAFYVIYISVNFHICKNTYLRISIYIDIVMCVYVYVGACMLC